MTRGGRTIQLSAVLTRLTTSAPERWPEPGDAEPNPKARSASTTWIAKIKAEELPGIREPMAFRPEAAKPLNELADVFCCAYRTRSRQASAS